MKESALSVTFHQGQALCRFAETYATLILVLLENVQNAIDAGANRIEVFVDLKNRAFRVYDNGSGASQEQIQIALNSVSVSLKKPGTGKYGMFGIGFISPLSICSKYTFTSCPKGKVDEYIEYEFDTEVIKHQPVVRIPFSKATGLSFNKDGPTWWRSVVQCNRLTKDNRKSRFSLSELSGLIKTKFGEAIRSRKINIKITENSEGGKKSIDVDIPTFDGIKLNEFKEEFPEVGTVSMELYIARAPKGVRAGKVVLGRTDNPSRIKIEEFRSQVETFFDKKILDALGSGVFEGTILGDKVEIDESRVKFKDNDALFGLCLGIEAWWKKVGKETYDKILDDSKTDMYRQVGASLLPYIRSIMNLPEFRSVFERIKVGAVSDKHYTPPPKKTLGHEDRKSFTNQGAKANGKGSGGKTGDDSEPGRENKDHIPVRIYGGNGPRGTRKLLVKEGSAGISLSYCELDDIKTPFEFNPSTGELAINVNCSFFGLCQRSTKTLQDYQIELINMALALELHRGHDGFIPHEMVEYAYNILFVKVHSIRNASALVGQ